MTLLSDALDRDPLAVWALAFGSGGMAVVGGGATLMASTRLRELRERARKAPSQALFLESLPRLVYGGRA